jgi:hypothetical protein
MGVVYFESSTHLLHLKSFIIMCGCIFREDHKMYVGKNGVYSGNVKITAVTENYKMSVGVYFVSEVQITKPVTVVIGQGVS